MADIEYFYSAHSAFAFLGSARLMAIAEAGDARIVHKPYDLHHVMAELGSASFAGRTPAHKAYYFGREIERWAEHRGVAWLGKRPTHHSNDYTLANRVLIAGDRPLDDPASTHFIQVTDGAAYCATLMAEALASEGVANVPAPKRRSPSGASATSVSPSRRKRAWVSA